MPQTIRVRKKKKKIPSYHNQQLMSKAKITILVMTKTSEDVRFVNVATTGCQQVIGCCITHIYRVPENCSIIT